MAYNRCVGTRYCANNCPYKVRRFQLVYIIKIVNDYHMNDDLGRMVLNPDVKCSFSEVENVQCIQMTSDYLNAKKEGREVIEGEFQTACSNACSTGAMTLVI
jgi:molybdopterin-containing oxidoreductase family iron-sulfur binding subunit